MLCVMAKGVEAAARQKLGLAVVIGCLGVAVAFGAQFYVLGMSVVGFAIYVGITWNQALRNAPVAERNNLAIAALQRGDRAEAEKLIATLPTEGTYLARNANVQRGQLAFLDGDLKKAEFFFTLALSGDAGFLTRAAEEIQIGAATGMRAVVRAALGNREGALRDAVAAEREDLADSGTVSRAVLARALLAARKNDEGELRDALRKLVHGIEWLSPRERVLVRGLRRFMVHGKRSVYREAAPRGDDEQKLFAWAQQVSPELAGFMLEGHTEKGELPLPPASSAKAVVTSDGERPTSPETRARWLGVAIVAAIYAVYFVVSRFIDEVPDVPPSVAREVAGGIFAIVVALFILQRRRKNIFAIHELRQALVQLARGELQPAKATYARFAKRTLEPGFAATGEAGLAAVASRKGDFKEVTHAARRGLAHLTASHRVLHSESLVPILLSWHAVGRAACGNADAKGELAALRRDHPSYFGLPSTEFRVLLVLAVKGENWEEATKIAAARSANLGLPIIDELIADLVTAAYGAGVTEDEAARIRAEMSEPKERAELIEKLAPGLAAKMVIRAAAEA